MIHSIHEAVAILLWIPRPHETAKVENVPSLHKNPMASISTSGTRIQARFNSMCRSVFDSTPWTPIICGSCRGGSILAVSPLERLRDKNQAADRSLSLRNDTTERTESVNPKEAS
jgi:hypothetical protein